MDHRWGIVWPDSHDPYHDIRARTLLFEFCGYAKPDFHIHIGDLMNCASVSRHNQGNMLVRVKNPIEQDFESADTFWKTLELINPKADKVWIEGNHEYWLKMYLASHPETTKIVDIENHLNLAKRNILFVPYETHCAATRASQSDLIDSD